MARFSRPGAGRDGDERTAVAVDERERTDPTRRVETRDHEHRDDAHVAPGGHERAQERFGGFSWGSDLFGFLTAVGLTGILAGILSAAGAALGLTEAANDAQAASAETISLAGAIALLVVLAIAYFCGGYVAGRMSRFDGARQGVGVWLWGIVIAVLVAVAAAVLGSEYNVLSGLNVPNLPVDQGDLATAGLIALAAMLVVTLLAAIAGGKLGQRFHTKVDRVEAGTR